MHVVVTGGGGFIGSNPAAAYLAEGHRVAVLDGTRGRGIGESGRLDSLAVWAAKSPYGCSKGGANQSVRGAGGWRVPVRPGMIG